MSWITKQLSDLGRVVTGKTPLTNEPKFFGGEYLFITPSDLNYNHYYCYSTDKTVTSEAKRKHKNQFLPADSVLFTCIGNTIGKAAIAPSECLTNQQINSIIANEDNDFKFIYYLLSNNIASIKSLGSGAATPIINKTSFGQIRFAVPALDVQKRISRILSAYDDLIDNNSRRIALLEKAARMLYEEWFVRLQFPGHEHTPVVDGVPKEWKMNNVRSCAAYVSRGISPSYDDESEGIVINQKCVRNNFVDLGLARRQNKAYKEEKQVLKGDVLINSTGTGTLGRVAQLWQNLPNCTVDSHVTIVRPNNETSICWLGYQLSVLEPVLENMGEGSTNQKELGRDRIAGIDILVPSKTIQHAFEGLVTPIKEQVNVLAAQNIRLQQARDLLLPRLMSGELAV